MRHRLTELGASWVVDNGEVAIHSPWGHLVADSPPSAQDEATAGARRTFSRGALLILQHMVEHPRAFKQTELADAVEVSQPRVAQVLKDLRRDGLAVRAPTGWITPDASSAFAILVETRPPETLMTTRWFSLRPVRDQIQAIQRQARAERVAIRLCGDWAADLLAPWRRPGLVAMHADALLDLEDADFVPSDDEAATVILHVGRVRTGWTADEAVVRAMSGRDIAERLAPVSEIAREILSSGGGDAADAVAELKRAWLAGRMAAAATD
jgi:hypothetical protein